MYCLCFTLLFTLAPLIFQTEISSLEAYLVFLVVYMRGTLINKSSHLYLNRS